MIQLFFFNVSFLAMFNLPGINSYLKFEAEKFIDQIENVILVENAFAALV